MAENNGKVAVENISMKNNVASASSAYQHQSSQQQHQRRQPSKRRKWRISIAAFCVHQYQRNISWHRGISEEGRRREIINENGGIENKRKAKGRNQ